MSDELKMRAQSAPWLNGVEVLITHGRAVAKIQFEEIADGTCYDPDSILRLSIPEAQTLMDDLWQAGLRPTEGRGSAGSLRATESHLADMRKIAFKKLGIE